MKTIEIKDNQDGVLLKDKVENNDLLDVIKSLQDISLIPVKDLLHKCNRNVFLLSNEDKIEDKFIFWLSYANELEKCMIHTGNIAGFVEYKGIQIDITSRFANGKNDFFLHYMLSKVFNINLTNLQHSEEKDKLFDFLIFLFPYYLKESFKKGIFRRYERFSYNDSHLKGTIDIPRFVRKDIPFLGKIAYNTREYTADNILTELVRHTIEYIKVGRYKSILVNSEISKYVKSIIESTPSYSKNKRELIINRNLKPIRHPYYSEWTDLQAICLAILRHRKIRYSGENDNKVHGILFDVSWLWEEYLSVLLKPRGVHHTHNRTGQGRCYLFNDGSAPRYPDYYSADKVFDAKYKRLGKHDSISSIDRDDMHQMITYMHCLKKKSGVFLYPVGNGRNEKEKDKLEEKSLNGFGGSVGAYGLKIPSCDNDSFTCFSNLMKESEDEFISRLFKN